MTSSTSKQSAATRVASDHDNDLEGTSCDHVRPQRSFANPAPLGLAAFALTTFVLSMINLGAGGIHKPNLVIAIAFAYGGLIQLLAGM